MVSNLKSEHCVDCGEPIHKGYLRCRRCCSKGKLNPMFGKRHSKDTIRKIKEKAIGNRNQWKGGVYKNSDGRTFLRLPNHSMADTRGYVYRYRLVASEIVRRPLSREEHVHHIDGNTENDIPDNLLLFRTNSDHVKYHAGKEVKYTDLGKLNEKE